MAKHVALDIRRPTQKRGRERFEAVLDAAEALLEEYEPTQISVYTIADKLGASPQSVYHFFPEVSLVFVALAERYLEWFQQVPLNVVEPVASWQELLDKQCRLMRAVYDSKTAVRKVLLGAGYSSEVRRRDLDSNRVLAVKFIEALEQRFVVPAIPGLIDRMVEMIVINDALWMLSIHRHQAITEAAEEQARRARINYLRMVLPEYLHPRSPRLVHPPGVAPSTGKRPA
jgi:AcrR family transcriptional regulator